MSNRRTFIKSSAFLAGSLALSPSILYAKSQVAASDKIRVALIGCNNMA
ncbi:hypothetical protein [Algoriphagus boritolerans]